MSPRPTPSSALYVTDRWDAPYRYRCAHAVRQLRAAGWQAQVRHVDDAELLALLGHHGVIVLFRLPWSERVGALVEGARRVGVPLVFDIDDLLFDPALGHLLPFRRRYSEARWEQVYGEQMRRLARTFEASQLFVGSTPALVRHAEALGKPARLHPNLVPPSYLHHPAGFAATRRALRRRPALGYFSGSDTHDDDLASIGAPLSRVLRARPELLLVLAGHVALPPELRAFEGRVQRLPFVDWRVYPLGLAFCHATLAPAATVNAFTDAKSALKFFEAGAIGVPTIASPAAELERSIAHGRTGWLASSADEWEAAMLAALDEAVATSVGAAARRAVAAEHSAVSHAGRLAGLLATVAVQPPRGGLARQRGARIAVKEALEVAEASLSAARTLVRLSALAGRSAAAADLGPAVPPPSSSPLGREPTGARQAEPGGAQPRRGYDIVVPIYGALDLTLRCVQSAARHARGDYRLVLLDDASPEPTVYPALQRFVEGQERAVLLRNSVNEGFVRTANRGLAGAAGRDVLLLNSDAEVFEGFSDGLREAAYAGERVGVVCPLSDNATLCSVPEFCRPNPLPEGMTGEAMAALVQDSSLRRRPELVTPHGFCMYIRRECLDEVGLFDADTFGRGFGEENDFGERARSAGWQTRLADDVYVRHQGKASFGEEGRRLEGEHARRLEARWSGYHARVASFVRANPLRAVHEQLREQLRRRAHRLEPAPLLVLHASPFSEQPGGVEHCVRDLVRAQARPRVVLVAPAGPGLEVTEVLDGDLSRPLRYFLPLSAPVPRVAHAHPEVEALLERVMELFFTPWAELHHSMGWPLTLGRLLRSRGVPYRVIVHDFYLLCPSHNLLDHRTLTLCGPAGCSDAQRARGCVSAACSAMGDPVPSDPAALAQAHRALAAELLGGAEQVVFPSPSCRSLVLSVHAIDPARAHVVEHGLDVSGARHTPPITPSFPRASVEPLRVALVGAIAHPQKGARSYLETLAACAALPVEWHVFGRQERFGFEQALTRAAGARPVVRHGPYERERIVHALRSARVDVGLLLPSCPETFSYTLSELLVAGVPVIATRHGALGDRLRGVGCGVLVDGSAEAARVLRDLCAAPERLRALQGAAARFEHPTPEAWASRYDAFDAALRRVRPAEPRRQTRAEHVSLAALRAPLPEPSGVAAWAGGDLAAHQGAWWYATASRFSGRAPETLRAWSRRLLSPRAGAPLWSCRLPGPRATPNAGLRVERRYWRTTRLQVTGPAPALDVRLGGLAGQRVRAVRFDLWCYAPSTARAKLWWKGPHQDFDDQRCVETPLRGDVGDWLDYELELGDGLGVGGCTRSAEITGLRLGLQGVSGVVLFGRLEVWG